MNLAETLITLIAIAFVAAIIIIGVAAILEGPVEGIETVENENGLEYEKFIVDGMECVYVQRGFGDFSHAGLSCDWSR